MTERLRIALAGNPNSGKTTLFNRLTGARQRVGNFPGVTIEKRSGVCRHENRVFEVVDLPGIYSLTAHSADEVVARDYLLEERPDAVVAVLDASNLERNLYLAVQLLELGLPVILALNMSDVAAARGLAFDAERLSEHLGAPVVPMVAVTGVGVKELLEQISSVAGAKAGSARAPMSYGTEIDHALSKLTRAVAANPSLNGHYPPAWIALKLIESDGQIGRVVPPELLAEASKEVHQLEESLGDSPSNLVADARYRFITDACSGSVRSAIAPRRTGSDHLDALLTNRWLGIPIFFGLMYLVFQLTFTLGAAPMTWIESVFSALASVVAGFWPAGSDSALKSLLVDGVIGGVGGVIVFLPNILLLFLAIAILDDSGYMARVAFLMDRVMRKVGLHGKSFIPLLTGFGCSVPAIMAARTIEGRRDRFATIMVTPLMSCGARLPIYALLIPAFFPPRLHAPMLWLIYLIGIALAIAAARVLRSTLLKGPPKPFLLELPPYRFPTVRSVLLQMRSRSWLYLRKAGTIILGISILLWALTRYPQLPNDTAEQAHRAQTFEEADAAADAPSASAELAHSFAGRIGRAIEPVLKPLGFDWRIGTALIGAFAAKEVFVAQLGIVFSIDEASGDAGSLRKKLRTAYSPLTAFCIMLFCLTGMPCMATVAVTRHETNSWKWALFQLGGLTALAYVLTLLVYQAGSLLGLGTH
jgi:ferrous iron transport protein B